jgi:hypothetical protein
MITWKRVLSDIFIFILSDIYVFDGGSPSAVDGDIQVRFFDSSLIDRCTGFAIRWTEEGGFGYKISSPAGIFDAELTALFVTLQHIVKVIQPPEKCLILTDSMSSV